MVRTLDASRIGEELLKKHNLHPDWKMQYNKSTTKLGACHFEQKVIEISVHLLNSCTEAEFIDTMLHEIAHALVGPEAGHGEIWANKAKEIGCTAKITGAMYVETGRAVQSSQQKEKKHIAPLTNVCPTCGKTAVEVSRVAFPSGTWLKLECGHLVRKDSISFNPVDSWTSESGKTTFGYQKEGIDFIIKSNGRCLIADEPGLGKTIQGLGFLKFKPEIALPALIVVKTTLKLQWMHELLDWCGISYFPQIIVSSKDFIKPGMKCYVISMDMLRRFPIEKIKALGIKTIIADEIQHFKNPDSSRTQELRRLVNEVDYFIALSGTPWKNRGSEYFSILNMLSPERFPTYNGFISRWVDYEYDNKTGKYRQTGIKQIEKFREYTKDFVIRRMRDDVLPDLPKINRQIRYVELESIYGESYEKAEKKVAEIIKDMMLGDSGNFSQWANLAAEIMKLKHITGLAKVDACVEDVIQFLEETPDDRKITVFHHHIDVGDDLEIKLNKWLSQNNYPSALRLRGGESSDKRANTVESFKEPLNRVLVASTLASGEGLNLQFCTDAIMMERQWNPANEEQAELRFSRPGSVAKESIRIPYLICGGTIDEMLTEIVEKKRLAYRKAMNVGDENLQWSENDIMKELSDAIVRKRYGKK